MPPYICHFYQTNLGYFTHFINNRIGIKITKAIVNYKSFLSITHYIRFDGKKFDYNKKVN